MTTIYHAIEATATEDPKTGVSRKFICMFKSTNRAQVALMADRIINRGFAYLGGKRIAVKAVKLVAVYFDKNGKMVVEG